MFSWVQSTKVNADSFYTSQYKNVVIMFIFCIITIFYHQLNLCVNGCDLSVKLLFVILN